MMDEVGEVGGSKPTLLLFAKATALKLRSIDLFIDLLMFMVMIFSVEQLSLL